MTLHLSLTMLQLGLISILPPPLPYPYVSGKTPTGFSSNLSFMAFLPSPLYGMKLPLKLNVTSFMTLLTKPWTHHVPSKLSNLLINYPGGTPPWTNQDGMPTGLIFTITIILPNTTKSNSKEHIALTSASANRPREKAGSNLFLARTIVKLIDGLLSNCRL